VARGGAAEAAGMAAGDEWLALGCGNDIWRVKTLVDAERIAKWQPSVKGAELTVWLSRDGRLQQAPLTWPDNQHRATAQLQISDHEKLRRWLTP